MSDNNNKLGPVGRFLDDHQQASEKLNKAWNEFFQASAKALGIYKVVGWLEKIESKFRSSR